MWAQEGPVLVRIWLKRRYRLKGGKNREALKAGPLWLRGEGGCRRGIQGCSKRLPVEEDFSFIAIRSRHTLLP